jgi:hypothetical protein
LVGYRIEAGYRQHLVNRHIRLNVRQADGPLSPTIILGRVFQILAIRAIYSFGKTDQTLVLLTEKNYG